MARKTFTNISLPVTKKVAVNKARDLLGRSDTTSAVALIAAGVILADEPAGYFHIDAEHTLVRQALGLEPAPKKARAPRKPKA